MSGAKRLMEEDDDKRRKAASIAHEAGVLTVCEDHDEAYRSEKDLVEAYKIGAWRFKRGLLGGVFTSQQEVTDYIKNVADDANISCYVCDKIRYE